jgi:hypothetical protein
MAVRRMIARGCQALAMFGVVIGAGPGTGSGAGPAAVLGTIGVAHAAPLVSPPVAHYGPKGHPPGGGRLGPNLGPHLDVAPSFKYLYVDTFETFSMLGTGGGATLVQGDPAVGVDDYHSLGEIAVISDRDDIVEIGWTVDLGLNGDLEPHLFSFHWVRGEPTCYNACGWIQVSPDKAPGMRLVPGEAHRFEIRGFNGDWWLFYDGEALGYYPTSIWSETYKLAEEIQWFGEVAAATVTPCTQMGNSKVGSDAAAATFTDLHIFDQYGNMTAAAVEQPTVTDPTLYDIGQLTPTSFGFGGPGAASGCCTPASCTAMSAECGTLADPMCPGHTLACGDCGGGLVCSDTHACPGGIGPRDDGQAFDAPPIAVAPDGAPIGTSSGGCCDTGRAGTGGAGTLGLAGLVALAIRVRRRRFPRP